MDTARSNNEPPLDWQQRLVRREYDIRLPPKDGDAWKASLAIQERLFAAVSEPGAPFQPDQLRQLRAGGRHRIISSVSEHEQPLWDALLDNNFAKAVELLLPRSRSPDDQLMNASTMESLHKSWNTRFYGDSLNALKEAIGNAEKRWKKDEYYAKSFPIIQSSGTGKSRLLDELSKEFFSISFTLRLKGETGYPPGDLEVTEFLRRDGPIPLNHELAVGILAGALHEANIWCSDYLNNHPLATLHGMASAWRDKMAPVHIRSTNDGPSGSLDTRSEARKDFCNKVVEFAKYLHEELSRDSKWRELYDSHDYDSIADIPLVRAKLIEPAQNLAKLIQIHASPASAVNKEARESIPLFFVFDETSNLYVSDKDHRFVALRRVLRCLCQYPIWSFFLSTQSKTEYLAPSTENDPSARIFRQNLKRFDPFLGLELNVEAIRRMADPKLLVKEREKPLSDFATANHMTMFGRPLWLVYRKKGYRVLREAAISKLLCGTIKYNPRNEHHAFAALASRLCLDPCLDTDESTSLAREAVNSHLRIVVGMDPKRGIMSTTTPSEPIVADAVAEMLVAGTWARSISTAASELFRRGLVDKGLKGELFARLVCVLARDFLLSRKDTGSQDFKFSQPFTVVEFLEALFAKNYHPDIIDGNRQSQNTTRSSTRSPTLGEVFKSAYMNFTHFTSTDQGLKAETLYDLLHNLMRQQAALQLSFCQPYWDLLIPIYFGDPKSSFDPSRLSAMVIQVKNTVRGNHLQLGQEYQNYFGANKRVICLLFDLGANVSSLQTIQGSSHVFGIDAKGAKANTFSCIRQSSGSLGLEDASMDFLKQVIQNWKGKEDAICQRNRGFHHHSWGDRFPAMHRPQDQEETDRDEPMDD